MALNVFIRGLSSRGFRVKTTTATVPDHVVADRGQAGSINAVQVDVDRPEVQRILSRETDNFIRAADATTTTIVVRGLHRTGFRIKNSAGNWVKVKRGVSATIQLSNAESRRILRRNKRDWIRMTSATATAVSIRGLETGAHETPRGVGFAVRDIGTKASVAISASNLTLTAQTGGDEGNGITIALVNPGGTAARSIVVTNKAIVVNLAVTAGAINGSETGTSVATSLNADAAASALVSAAGTGTVLIAVAATPLAGGTDEGGTLTNIRAGASVTVRPDEPETANMLRRHHKKWIEVDA